jgi:hypothetical protein
MPPGLMAPWPLAKRSMGWVRSFRALASAVALGQVPKFGRGKNQGAKPLKRVSAKAREVARAMAVRRLYFT